MPADEQKSTSHAHHRRHVNIAILLEVLTLILIGSMFALKLHGQSRNSWEDQRTRENVAVLTTRANEIDEHLRATDADVTALTLRMNQMDKDFSEKTGEERAAWAILGLLSSGTLAVQIKGKPKSGGS